MCDEYCDLNLHYLELSSHLGAVSILRCRLSSIGIPMLKIRRFRDRLIFNMGIPIPGKDGIYNETGPSFLDAIVIYKLH